MSGPLPTDLRNLLARVIKEARRVAGSGARKALEGLAVQLREPHGSMTGEEEKLLRKRLRAHGRQLGDARDTERGTQQIDRLAREVAYEHWHRMLFARFLAENRLLIEPDSGVAITMAECDELARERGEDPWVLASRFAQRMLPRIFRPDDPALEVALAPETRQALERLLESLPAAVFTADDSLGWTYQFWQAEKKDEINKIGVKIGADELPAVTQLFTEHYMVLFLFHNTIGAWRAGKILAERPDLAQGAQSEGELRQAVRLGSQDGYDFTYLRFVRESKEGDEESGPAGPWRPAAGVFEGWPKRAAELRVLDPCCGSGHFLVAGFELLVRLRMEEEGLPLEDAVRAVLAENLFGLEIDPRCTQIAAFNVALAAWKLTGRPIELPPLQIACSGLAVGVEKKEWLALAGQDERLRGGMDRLYDLFEKAPELGSLIDPRSFDRASTMQNLYAAEFGELEPLLAGALGRRAANEDQTERAVAAQGMARAAELLAGQYTLVITNVPYLGRGNQTDVLRSFCDQNYKEAKADLATVFVSRILRWLGGRGTVAAVTPQNWLFLTSYRKLREQLLTNRTWGFVVNLGPAAFRDMNWWAARTALLVLSAGVADECNSIAGINLSSHRITAEKSALLRGEATQSDDAIAADNLVPHAAVESGANLPAAADADASGEVASPADGSVCLIPQAEQLKNPDARISLVLATAHTLLSEFARSFVGLQNNDTPKNTALLWEISMVGDGWDLFQLTTERTKVFSGRSGIVRWPPPPEYLIKGTEAWGHDGLLIRPMSELPATLYNGQRYDQSSAAIISFDSTLVSALWCFCSSPEFAKAVRRIDQKLNVTNATLVKVPFDLAHWQKVAAEKYPNGLPEPHSDDPTQWLFHGHPAKAEPATALQVAIARLLGYRWPPEHDPEMRLAAGAREWVDRCHSLDPFADRDGIVCLTAIRGEVGAADRLRRLLAASFGSEWSAAKERELLAAAAGDGSPAATLEEWLRDSFFEEHCRLFHHRPFVWHIWDGRKDGFHALVNYHRLAGPNGEGRRTLQALTYSYLGDWIDRQKAEQREGKEGADARLAAAQNLQAQLERIMAGEPPYDIFVRWKSLHQQPIGWEPDINDGVRLNIRPFLSVELRTGGRRGAGILRWKPNIKWDKDRGKEPQSLRPKADFPWFWSCPGDGSLDDRTDFLGAADFDGNRWNDLHYTNAGKRAVHASAGR